MECIGDITAAARHSDPCRICGLDAMLCLAEILQNSSEEG